MMSHADWFESYESPNNPTMCKLGMPQFTPFSMSVMSHLGKTTNKFVSKTSCIYQPSQRIWSQSATLLSKACKSDSTKVNHILELARAMLNEKHMPKSYWVEAACTVVHLMNQCTTSSVHEVIHHKKYYGKQPYLSHVRIFGSIVFVHIPDEKR